MPRVHSSGLVSEVAVQEVISLSLSDQIRSDQMDIEARRGETVRWRGDPVLRGATTRVWS